MYTNTKIMFSKIASAMTIFMMVFSLVGFNPNTANATALPPICLPNSEEVYVSEAGDDVDSGSAVVTAFEHDNWYPSASMGSGAEWIWHESIVSNPTDDETDVFTKTITVTGNFVDAEIEIAADNGYKIEVNGSEVVDKLADAENFGALSSHSLTFNSEDDNTLEITVKNFGLENGTSDLNPAGLLYKLTVNTCTPPAPIDATISATKIICPEESMLPNWGDNDPEFNITSNTASRFLSINTECYPEDWTFEWAPDGTTNPGDNELSGGDEWTPFASTAMVPAGSLIWVREQMPDGYLPFSGDLDGEDGWNDVSAELYCSTDVLNYDNYDWINPVVAGETYHCIAFNVEEGQQCEEETFTNEYVSDATTMVGVNPASVLSFIHTAWTAVIDDASWIWSTDPVVMVPVVDEVETFTKTFTVDKVNNTITGATLMVAADNSYSVTLNGNPICEEASITDVNFSLATQDICNIDASDLLNGSNTLSFTVTNKNDSGENANTISYFASINPAGLMYKLTIDGNSCDGDPMQEDMCPNIQGNQETIPDNMVINEAGNCVVPQEPYQCNPEENLILNGGFEDPALDANTWSIIPSSNPLLKWLATWVGIEDGGTEGLEIQNNVAGASYNGSSQHAELDGDHPTTISQDVATVIGEAYNLNFAYSARPGVVAPDNDITVKVDGNVLGAVLSDDGTGDSDTMWNMYTRSFVATDTTTTIEFTDTGADTSLGGYLDEVSLSCDSEPAVDMCPDVFGIQTTNLDCLPPPPMECPEGYTGIYPSCYPPIDMCPDGQIMGEQGCYTPDNGDEYCLDQEAINYEEMGECEYNNDTPEETPNRSSSGSRVSRGGGSVLGAATDICNWNTQNLRRGWKGNIANDVETMQNFLNLHMNSGLLVDKVFGPKTEEAVKAFQLKYMSEILTPWNINSPTGIWYLSTTTKAKEIMCGAKQALPTLINWSQNPIVR